MKRISADSQVLAVKTLLLLLSLLILFFSYLPFAWAENSKTPYLIRDITEDPEKKLTGLVLPFAFYSETFEFTVGVGGGATGFQEGQMGLYGAGLYSANGTAAFYFAGNDIRIPFTRRLFLDPYMSYGWFAQQRAYFDGNPDFPNEQAGSNDSSADNYLTEPGNNNIIELRFKYVLPIGQARESAVQSYILDQGLILDGASGGGGWNPLTSGVTYLQIKPFYRYRTFEFTDEVLRGSTSGMEIGLHYDNRDFPLNPTAGSKMHLTYGSDFGRLNGWSVLSGKVSKYVSLGKSKMFRQRVLALDLWLADNVNRKVTVTPGGVDYDNQSIPSYGPALGGLYRMRAYPQYRFHDKVAIYYGAEYRVMPKWRPLKDVSWLQFLDVDWWQVVGIAELGRVDTDWSASTFYNDLHWSVGGGLRLMSRKVVVRLDAAFSEEGGTMWAMAGHAF